MVRLDQVQGRRSTRRTIKRGRRGRKHHRLGTEPLLLRNRWVSLTVLGHVVQRLFLNVRQDAVQPASRLFFARSPVRVAHPILSPAAAGKTFLLALVVDAAERQLLQVVHALGPPGSLASCLNGRQQQRDQNANDGNHDQQFDKRKPSY